MYASYITSKGQTTIPKAIRNLLHLQVNDKIVYIQDGPHVYMTPMKGTISDLAGTFRDPKKRPMDFKKLREQMKEDVARKYMRES